MALYYKFKSAKDYDSVPIDGHFISVANLKQKIFESKHLGRGTDFELVLTNAQTNEEYLDEEMLIPKNTSVLVRRVPGQLRMPIVTAPITDCDKPNTENNYEEVLPVKSSFSGADLSVIKYPEGSEWDEFGDDLYAIPEIPPVQPCNTVLDAPLSSKDDEDSKIKALIDTPALGWQCQTLDGFGPGRGFGRGVGGRMAGGRGFVNSPLFFGRGGFERKTPPQGYVCHRCQVPGHFIQHCPTNGDPDFDIKRAKPPTGIPKSMLMTTLEGSYALPSGAVAVLKPNEAVFDKEIEGLPSTHRVGDLPPELHCPLCNKVMKDAAFTSKCCFKSFCDKCIRDHVISKSQCVCGVTNVLADDLLPNKTLRDTINRIMESNSSSSENSGSAFQIHDMESHSPHPIIASPAQSAASKLEQGPPTQKEETVKIQETAELGKAVSSPQEMTEKGRTSEVADISEAMHKSASVKELSPPQSASLADKGQQKPVSVEAGKKKKKKARLLLSAAEMQWKASHGLAAENCMMNIGHSVYNPYWNGMHPETEGCMVPYAGAMPHMAYALGPLDVPFGSVLSHDPLVAQGFMFPFVTPQRDLADFTMDFTPRPPALSRDEFEDQKAALRRKHEIERHNERDFSKDKEFCREMSSSGYAASVKSKSVCIFVVQAFVCSIILGTNFMIVGNSLAGCGCPGKSMFCFFNILFPTFPFFLDKGLWKVCFPHLAHCNKNWFRMTKEKVILNHLSHFLTQCNAKMRQDKEANLNLFCNRVVNCYVTIFHTLSAIECKSEMGRIFQRETWYL